MVITKDAYFLGTEEGLANGEAPALTEGHKPYTYSGQATPIKNNKIMMEENNMYTTINTNETVTNNNEGVVNMNTNTNTNEAVTNNNNMEVRTMNMTRLISQGNSEEIIARLEGSRKFDKAAFKMIKQESKNMKVVGSRQIIFSAEKSEEGKFELKYDVRLNVSLESSLIRSSNVKPMKMADKSMVLTIEGTEELSSVNLDNSLFQSGKTEADRNALKAIRARVFNLMKGGSKGKSVKETLNLIVSESGLARVELNKDVKLKDGEVMTGVRFLGVSPSGLRSKSVITAAINRRSSNGVIIDSDRRIKLLDSSIDGSLSQFLSNDKRNFLSLDNKLQQFKNATRLTMGAPGSKELSEIKNYIVFDNLAKNAKFKDKTGAIKDASNTRDGNIFISAEWELEVLVEAGIPVNLYNIVGITDQLRGAGLKCSSTYETRKSIVTTSRRVLRDKSNVSYAVVNGVRYNSWDDVVNAGVAGELFNNLDAIADENAMKLLGHKDVFKPVRLKMAYQSDMNLNLVTAMAMLNYNQSKAIEVLREIGIKSITKKFNNMGVKFDFQNNSINGVELDLEGIKALNNESQFMTYLLKSDPEKVMKLFPGVIRSEFENMIKSIVKSIAKSEFELEDSKYTVVQADLAVLFDSQILEEDEIFCPGYDNGKELSITRHPISSLEAVSTLKNVGLKEVIERILALNIDISEKEVLIDYYGRAKQWCIIPASHRLMEKHDGMDFDIDAVQIIADAAVVAILKEIPDRGSVIKDHKEAVAARHSETSEEKAILAAQLNNKVGFVRPGKSESEAVNASNTVSSFVKIKSADIHKACNEVIDLSFDQICSMTEDYFGTTIASVGVIANAFYVNGLTLATLKSDSVDATVKVRIARAFRKYYGCKGTEQYVSNIDRSVQVYEVEKFDCTEAVFKFAECDGSLHSLITFLEDCCDYNRYLAETSIDSAKNNFYIINMFNHAKIVTPKGAKQNCKVELVNADDTFSEIAKALDLSQSNFFKLNMLEFNCKGLTAEQWDECSGEQVSESGAIQQVAIQVEDPLYILKEERRVLANTLIVVAAKLFEDVVLSKEARELRKDMIAYADSIVGGSNVAPSIDSIKKSYSTLTLGLKSDESSDEIEGVSTVEYLKTVAINGLKNFKDNAFSDFSTFEVGAIVVNSLVSAVSEETCGTINAALYKVCEAEMIEFLADFGLDNVGFIGEAISYAELNGRKVKLSELIGMNITAIEGEAVLEDGTVVVMKDRRADIAGTVIDINGKYFIKAIKEFDQANAEDGIYLNVNKGFEKYCVNADKFQAVSYRFEPTYKVNNTKVYCAIVGTNAEGQEGLIACVTCRANVTSILKVANLDNLSIFSHTNRENQESRVVYLPGADFVAASDAVNNVAVSNDFSFDFVAPIPDATQEAAIDTISSEENTDALFGGFDFGMPV